MRETQTSTPLTEGSSHSKSPQIGITPAVADCRYRAPLSPRLRDSMSIPVFKKKVNGSRAGGTDMDPAAGGTDALRREPFMPAAAEPLMPVAAEPLMPVAAEPLMPAAALFL